MLIQERIKQQQNLYSWNFFYSNQINSIMASRYHKVLEKPKYGKEGDEPKLTDVSVKDGWNNHYGQVIYHSQRYREDRKMSNKISAEIKENQLIIDKYFDSKKKTNERKGY